MEAVVKTNQIPRVERGMTKVYVPHEGKEVAFAYPSVGPGTYTNIGKEILEQRMKVPTGSETASLLHSAYCVPEVNDEREFQNVRDIMKDRWLWVFNRNLWTSEGVYVVQDPEATGRIQPLNQNELEKMLSGGKEVRPGVIFSKGVNFAGKETYQLEKNDSYTLAKNGFMIASYGEEGAEKLAEISTKFKAKPYIYGLKVSEGEEPIQTLSALGRGWYFGLRLDVDGGSWDDDDDGHSFGVFAPEKNK